MADPKLYLEIAEKDSDKEKIAKRVARYPTQVQRLIDGLTHENPGVKYGCAKVIRSISEQKPAALYPFVHTFVDLLDSDKNIMKWEGIYVLGKLAPVDEDNVIDSVLKKYLAPIPGPALITAANVIGGAASIATAKPYLAGKIANAILKVKDGRYKTRECRNVALGQAIDSFGQFFEHIKNKKPVLDLIKAQKKNKRNSTRKKAEQFLKKLSK